MFCKNCGKAMNENQAVCIECGVKTGDGNKFCANCGQPVAENAEVCLSCGVAVKKSAAGNLGGQDKIVIALLCFFLGEIGVHNFVMKETKKGVFKIILLVGGFILCGIPSLICVIFKWIDLVKILIDKYEVNPDKLI